MMDVTQINENIDLLAEEREKVDEMLSIRYITKKNAVFERTEGGFVSLKIEDEFYPRVALHRAFPFSSSNEYISVRCPDEKAREIGIIKNLKELDKKTQKTLLEQMNLRYFMPKIEKIINIKEEYGYAYWDVVTDRGECRFTISMHGTNVARVSETHIIVQDIDSNRFEIPDITKLSIKEIKKLDLYI